MSNGRAIIARCGSPMHTSGGTCLGHEFRQCPLLTSHTIPCPEIAYVDSWSSPTSEEDRTICSTMAENIQKPLLPLHISSLTHLGLGGSLLCRSTERSSRSSIRYRAARAATSGSLPASLAAAASSSSARRCGTANRPLKFAWRSWAVSVCGASCAKGVLKSFNIHRPLRA